MPQTACTTAFLSKTFLEASFLLSLVLTGANPGWAGESAKQKDAMGSMPGMKVDTMSMGGMNDMQGMGGMTGMSIGDMALGTMGFMGVMGARGPNRDS